MKRTISFLLFALLASFSFSQGTSDNKVISSESHIDWTKTEFISNIYLNTEKAAIELPSGKKTATSLVSRQIPSLIKDPLLSLNVSSTEQIGDLVLDGSLTLGELTGLIDDSRKSSGIFTDGSLTMKTEHVLDLKDLNPLMVLHKVPYKNQRPIETSPSRAYTGIIIDARGTLSVQGEFVKDTAEPCFFPKVWDEDMNLIYERNMVLPETVIKTGMVRYDWQDDESGYQDRIGNDPMRIKARKVYGEIRTDPVISRKDALKILNVAENLELLKQGKVVILLDKGQLIRTVTAPEKTAEYYAALKEIKQYMFENNEEDLSVHESEKGIQLLYDLKFAADQAVLLDTEFPKVRHLADILKRITVDNGFTILVEGHTADVNKPEGQMKLSIERTQAIIEALVQEGLPRDIFSFRGYGGTEPVASNDTAEGRAMNRRVIITARPKSTYIIPSQKTDDKNPDNASYIKRN